MTMARPAVVPRATYRLQLHAGFGFTAAAAVPYLARLGISHLYVSPILMARPGSTHGYDVTDFNRLNPELGGDAGFEVLCGALREHGLGLVVDFVPNHMAVGADNPWWADMLEWGQESPFEHFFDIDWEASAAPGVRDKVMLPVLGNQYGTVLEAGELQLRFDAGLGTFRIEYYDNRFPIAVRDYAPILHAASLQIDDGAALGDLAARFEALGAGGTSQTRRSLRRQEANVLKSDLLALATTPEVRDALDATLTTLNGTAGEPASFRRLHRLLENQAYRLAYWRVARSDINYRRFFDINDLAGLRMERAEVFDATHGLLLRLITDGVVQGVRLDHIDGLYDPAGYCRRLLERVRQSLEAAGRTREDQEPEAAPIWLLVEKILARHEYLREDLPVAGTTGYEFMALVNGLFVNPASERPLTRFYTRFSGVSADFAAHVRAAKRQILRASLGSELQVLAQEVHRLARQSWRTRDFTYAGIREALADIVVAFPVYRTYITEAGPKPEDRRDLEWAISQARKETLIVDQLVFEFLYRALSTDLAQEPGYRRRDVVATAMHFQQLTGPVMAKSLEDTAFYRFLRLVSLNEVGGEPDHFGVSPSAFHTLAARQFRHQPHSMVTTSTHDHKRGEDTRARINVISELPLEWGGKVRRWAVLNRFKRQDQDERPVPSRNDEYLIYQTLIGSWPLDVDAPEQLAGTDYADRIVAYMIKAVREAKVDSAWTAQDPAYEAGLEQFVRAILDPDRARPFLADFLPFQARIALIGAVNGLAQVLLKLTAPGVPDLYQGTELWDLSLVDPDNRRPVDYDLRERHLAGEGVGPATLVQDWRSGRIKQLVVHRTLQLRAGRPDLFKAGAYVPLAVEGQHAERVVAFARQRGDDLAVVVVPRLAAPLLAEVAAPLPPAERWGQTRVVLPDDLPAPALRDRFTGRPAPPGDRALPVGDLLCDLPVALLASPVAGD